MFFLCTLIVSLLASGALPASGQWSLSEGCALTGISISVPTSSTTPDAALIIIVNDTKSFSMQGPSCTVRGNIAFIFSMLLMHQHNVTSAETADNGIVILLRKVQFEALGNKLPQLVFDFADSDMFMAVPVSVRVEDASWVGTDVVATLEPIAAIRFTTCSAATGACSTLSSMVSVRLDRVQMNLTAFSNQISGDDAVASASLVRVDTLSISSSPVAGAPAPPIFSLSGASVVLSDFHGTGASTQFYLFVADSVVLSGNSDGGQTPVTALGIRDCAVVFTNGSTMVTTGGRQVTVEAVTVATNLQLNNASAMALHNVSVRIVDSRGDDITRNGIIRAGVLRTVSDGPYLYAASMLSIDGCTTAVTNADGMVLYASGLFLSSLHLYDASTLLVNDSSVFTNGVFVRNSWILLTSIGNDVEIFNGSNILIENSSVTVMNTPLPNDGLVRALWAGDVHLRNKAAVSITHVTARYSDVVVTGSHTDVEVGIAEAALLVEDSSLISLTRTGVVVAAVTDSTDDGCGLELFLLSHNGFPGTYNGESAVIVTESTLTVAGLAELGGGVSARALVLGSTHVISGGSTHSLRDVVITIHNITGSQTMVPDDSAAVLVSGTSLTISEQGAALVVASCGVLVDEIFLVTDSGAATFLAVAVDVTPSDDDSITVLLSIGARSDLQVEHSTIRVSSASFRVSAPPTAVGILRVVGSFQMLAATSNVRLEHTTAHLINSTIVSTASASSPLVVVALATLSGPDGADAPVSIARGATIVVYDTCGLLRNTTVAGTFVSLLRGRVLSSSATSAFVLANHSTMGGGSGTLCGTTTATLPFTATLSHTHPTQRHSQSQSQQPTGSARFSVSSSVKKPTRSIYHTQTMRIEQRGPVTPESPSRLLFITMVAVGGVAVVALAGGLAFFVCKRRPPAPQGSNGAVPMEPLHEDILAEA